VILRLTQNLNARLKVGPPAVLPLDEDPLLDWSARPFTVGTAGHLLLSNTKSLYCTVLDRVGGEDATRFGERVLDVIRAVLEESGCGRPLAASGRCGSRSVSTDPSRGR